VPPSGDWQSAVIQTVPYSFGADGARVRQRRLARAEVMINGPSQASLTCLGGDLMAVCEDPVTSRMIGSG
jgi:hypothetical protein